MTKTPPIAIDNTLSIYLHALKKDCPGKTWWNCEATHPAVYRAMRIDPSDFGASYAVAPFRYFKGERHLILAAYPAPRILDPVDENWFGIETVIAWEPNSNQAYPLEDPSPQLAGRLDDEAHTLFADPRAFFQAWAIRRAQFAMKRQEARSNRWHAIPAERDETPGALILGDVDRIPWHPTLLPDHIECVGVDPKVVNKAIFKAARLPRVTAAITLRSAA